MNRTSGILRLVTLRFLAPGAAVFVFATLALAQSQPQTISTERLSDLLKGKGRHAVTLVDVRSWVEYQDAHLPGAIEIPPDAIAERLREKIKDKRRELVFYCGGGHCPYAVEAANAASDLGYTKLWVYQDGLAAWQEAKNPVEASAPLPVFSPEFVSAQQVLPVVEKKAKGTLIVDVRTRKEFAQSHLKNSINIPLDELEDKENRLAGKKVVFVCHAGGQSVVAARLLRKTGRKDMCVLRGGLAEWRHANLPYLEGHSR